MRNNERTIATVLVGENDGGDDIFQGEIQGHDTAKITGVTNVDILQK